MTPPDMYKTSGQGTLCEHTQTHPRMLHPCCCNSILGETLQVQCLPTKTHLRSTCSHLCFKLFRSQHTHANPVNTIPWCRQLIMFVSPRRICITTLTQTLCTANKTCSVPLPYLLKGVLHPSLFPARLPLLKSTASWLFRPFLEILDLNKALFSDTSAKVCDRSSVLTALPQESSGNIPQWNSPPESLDLAL